MSSASGPVVAVVLPGGEGFAPGAVGAVGLIVHRLAGVAGGFRVVVLAQAGGAVFADRAVLPVRAWPFPRLYARARYPWAVLWGVRRLRPALVEVHNRPALALFLARRLRVPVTLFLHNDPQGMRRAATVAERGRLLARLAGVAVVSEFLRARLCEGVPPGGAPVVVVPNGIDPAGLPAALPAAAREPLILFVGRPIVEKGVDTFLRAMALALPDLPGWRAVLLGSRDHTPGGEVPVADGVQVLGYRPHPEVLEWMGRAAMVVVPSRWAEPFGLTALEAMAMGAALLCSDRGGLPEVVGDAAVVIDPEDAPGLARAVVALAGDPARRGELAARGRARAGRFGVAAAAEALEGLRRSALVRPAASAAPPRR